MLLKNALISKAGGRELNEDFCSFREYDGFGCYVLADGLGGHQKGELASKTVGEAVLEAFTASPGFSSNLLLDYIEHARLKFQKVRMEFASAKNMKTTLLVLMTNGRQALWGHVGDSRLYYFRIGKITAQTSDHSVPQLLANSGEISYDQIRYHEDRNRLTAAFDGSEKMKFSLFENEVKLAPKDAFLLSSDGFWEHIKENEMEALLNKTGDPTTWLHEMENLLLSRVRPGHDNYSAMTILVDK